MESTAAPVLEVSGHCRAALNVCGPAYRLPPEKLPALGEACSETAKKIGAYLVWSSNGG